MTAAQIGGRLKYMFVEILSFQHQIKKNYQYIEFIQVFFKVLNVYGSMFIKRKYNLNNCPKMETFHKITTSLFHKQVRASPTPFKGNKII